MGLLLLMPPSLLPLPSPLPSQAIIFHDADVNAVSPEFDSPLHLAVLGNFVRIAQELIAK